MSDMHSPECVRDLAVAVDLLHGDVGAPPGPGRGEHQQEEEQHLQQSGQCQWSGAAQAYSGDLGHFNHLRMRAADKLTSTSFLLIQLDMNAM